MGVEQAAGRGAVACAGRGFISRLVFRQDGASVCTCHRPGCRDPQRSTWTFDLSAHARWFLGRLYMLTFPSPLSSFSNLLSVSFSLSSSFLVFLSLISSSLVARRWFYYYNLYVIAGVYRSSLYVATVICLVGPQATW